MSETTTDNILKAEINLYYDLKPGHEANAPLLIALHGYGANKRYMMQEAQFVAPEGFAIASLQGYYQHMREPNEKGGPMKFGFGWVTNFRPEDSVAIHHRALLDLIDKLVRLGIADPQQIFLLGFSQACAMNYRFAFTHPKMLSGVIGMCGGMPGDWETSDRYRDTEADVFHLTGTRDDFYTAERIRDYERQLRMRAAEVTFKLYDAAHEITQPMRNDIKEWLTERAR
ncbi:MAG TPA: dienelactone hydrolase family protein [Pyrinomonadaceae bacterium]